MATSTAQAIATVPVWDYLMNPGDATLTNPKGLGGKKVKISLTYDLAQSGSPVTLLGVDPVFVTTDPNGFWQANLIPNNKINPPGTLYSVNIEGYRTYLIYVTDVNVPGIGWQSVALAVLPPISGAAGYTLPGGTTILGGLFIGPGETGLDVSAPGPLLIGDNVATSIEMGTGAAAFKFSLQGDVVGKSLTLADNDYTTVRAGPGLLQVNGNTDQLLGGYSQFDGGINARGAAGAIWKLGFGAGSGWINGSNGVRGDSIASSAPNAAGATFFAHIYHNLVSVPFADKGSASAWNYYMQIDPYSGGGDVYGELAGFAGVVTNNRLGAATVGVEVTAQNNLNRGGRLAAFTAGMQENNASIAYYSRAYWATSYGAFPSGDAIRVDGNPGFGNLLNLVGTTGLGLFVVSGSGVLTTAAAVNINSSGYNLIFNSTRAVATAYQIAFLGTAGGNDATIGTNNDGSLHISGKLFLDAAALNVAGGNQGVLIGSSNIAGAIPASLSLGVAIGSNFNTGAGEVSTFNLYTAATSSFEWRQKTGASTSALLMALDPSGRLQHGGQVYPGAEALGVQTLGGLLHSTGVPSNANGNNNDWCISDNHHLYTKSGGVWIDMTATANSMSTPGNPAGTASAPGVMMGLAGAITPVRTGTIEVTISGDIFNNTITDGASVQIRWGTGTAPVNGAALTGTAVGAKPAATAAAASEKAPFSITVIISGLTLGVAVWLDLALAAVTGGTASAENLTITAKEI